MARAIQERDHLEEEVARLRSGDEPDEEHAAKAKAMQEKREALEIQLDLEKEKYKNMKNMNITILKRNQKIEFVEILSIT